jgi:hypothetical protein
VGELLGRRGTRSRLWRLWALASGLWTVATLLRVAKVWAPLVGWRGIVERPMIWISLIVPPLLFALIVGAIQKKIVPGR